MCMQLYMYICIQIHIYVQIVNGTQHRRVYSHTQIKTMLRVPMYVFVCIFSKRQRWHVYHVGGSVSVRECASFNQDGVRPAWCPSQQPAFGVQTDVAPGGVGGIPAPTSFEQKTEAQIITCMSVYQCHLYIHIQTQIQVYVRVYMCCYMGAVGPCSAVRLGVCVCARVWFGVSSAGRSGGAGGGSGAATMGPGRRWWCVGGCGFVCMCARHRHRLRSHIRVRKLCVCVCVGVSICVCVCV